MQRLTGIFGLFIIRLLFSCTKADAQLPCENDTTHLTSIIDLQSDYYLGLYQGGLYPGGSNELPYEHKEGGLAMAKKIKPLDSLGNVDWENGKVVFAGMGASTAGNAWNNFIDLVNVDSGINPCLEVVNACLGAKGLDVMIDTAENGWYWYDEIMPRILNKGVTRHQVQAVWIKTASKADTILEFPLYPAAIADKYAALMPILRDSFPNLQLVFVSGFFYGGYADPRKEFYDIVKEPGSYWTNFAVKWLVERQIVGVPELAYAGIGAKSPWVGWGPHVWADGTHPNETDGLYWDCEVDFQPDGGGYHLSNTGKLKEASLLLEWARTNPVTRKWFLDGPEWTSCDPDGRTADGRNFTIDSNIPDIYKVYVYQSSLLLEIPSTANTQVNWEIYDAVGNLVHRQEVAPGTTVTANLSHHASGLFISKITYADRMESQITKHMLYTSR
ncbi:MAG: hypothetical protein ABR94_00400 [Sphingobacteriales bacterium BACL12 MAG-120802-bin5]|jgi:hypothetical protein|nr:MAG: hypothetical protein ABR94_00400 [Sphingobacteriales bacterium BACL12 MAG-120802-bin5]